LKPIIYGPEPTPEYMIREKPQIGSPTSLVYERIPTGSFRDLVIPIMSRLAPTADEAVYRWGDGMEADAVVLGRMPTSNGGATITVRIMSHPRKQAGEGRAGRKHEGA
jgi:hypothetical protein